MRSRHRRIAQRGLAGLLGLGLALALTSTAWAAEAHIELFAPAREAATALQAARRAKAAELAPDDLRLAELHNDDAVAALKPASGAPDVERAARLFQLSAAEAHVAETRAAEIARSREAAGTGNQYLDAMNGDPQRILPPRPPLAQAAAEYRQAQRQAAAARAARRAAEEQLERLRSRQPR